MKIINVGLIGFGSGGRIYNAPVLTSVEGFEIKKILSSSPSNMEAAKRDFPSAQVVQELKEILEDREIKLVITVLPNHLHYTYVKKALNADKHVLVEKPFTTTSAEADELIELARKKNLVLTVNHNRRRDSDFRTVKKVIEKGLLGELAEYEAHFDRFRPEVKDSWKENKDLPGNGILYDLGSHLIDQALVLFGNPEKIFADIRIQRKGAEVPDNFEILLFYPGLKVSLKAGMLVKEKGATFSLHGSRGSFVKFGADVQEEALKNGFRPQQVKNWGEEPREIWGKLNIAEQEKILPSEPGDYPALYKNLYAAITGKEPLLVKPEQARNVIRVIELAYLSSSEERVIDFT